MTKHIREKHLEDAAVTPDAVDAELVKACREGRLEDVQRRVGAGANFHLGDDSPLELSFADS